MSETKCDACGGTGFVMGGDEACVSCNVSPEELRRRDGLPPLAYQPDSEEGDPA